ncbi:MAG: PIN domain-containing protein [Deltaproteobacteria bacterium]|nr:PIN domain-containing protein [Deltaproteobacteria bacterium]
MKVVYDTCIYIDFLRSGQHQDLFTSRDQIRYLSAVVMMELLSGARTPEHRRALDRLFLPYSKAHRLISLDVNHFYKAGDCLSHLRAKKNDIHLGLSHDVMIAISALSVGATLYTSNSKDFIRIQELLPVKTEYL